MYRRVAETRDGANQLIAPPAWPWVEKLRLAPPDTHANDNFGAALALNGALLTAGSVGADGLGANAGAAYYYNAEVQHVWFGRSEYVALEGTDNYVDCVIYRDTTMSDGVLNIHVATSDLTAQGIDGDKFDACWYQAIADRTDCGDY